MVARADSAGTSQPDRPSSFDSQRKQHGGGRVRPVSIEAPGGINNPARGVHRESANFAGGDLTSAGWRSSRYAVGIRPHSPGFIHPFGVFPFVDQEPPALRVARDLSGRAPGSDQSMFRPPDSFPHLRTARCDSAASRQEQSRCREADGRRTPFSNSAHGNISFRRTYFRSNPITRRAKGQPRSRSRFSGRGEGL